MSFRFGSGYTTKNHNAMPVDSTRRAQRTALPAGKRSSRGPQHHEFSDADVITALLMVELGISRDKVAMAIGCSCHAVMRWDQGVNRGHIRALMDGAA